MNIEDIINNLNLIIGVIPDYSEGRDRGLSDDKTETLAFESISQAIDLLENIQKR